MRRNRLPILNENERLILDYYISRYTEQKKDIELLNKELNDTKKIIDYITGVQSHVRTRETPRQEENPLRNFYYRMDFLQPTNLQNLEDVPVGVSSDVILRNTKSILFSEVESPLNLSCPIQLERFLDNDVLTQINGCGHLFFPSGLERWFQSHAHCPMCRYDIRTNELSESSSNNSSTSTSSTSTSSTSTSLPILSNYSNVVYTELDPSMNSLAEQILSNLFSGRNNR